MSGICGIKICINYDQKFRNKWRKFIVMDTKPMSNHTAVRLPTAELRARY